MKTTPTERKDVHMANGVLKMLCSLLVGMVLTGGGMLVREDALGRRAAQEVEVRLTKHIENEIGHILALMQSQSRTLERMEEKMDTALDRLHERED